MDLDRIAVLIPGGNYPAQGPLLAYARLAVERRGAQARAIAWSSAPPDPIAECVTWVRDQVAEALGTDSAVLIGKSLGTLAAGLATERRLPAVWLTPLLDLPEVTEAIAAAAHPPLLIGGTADRFWDGPTARRLSPHVLEIPDADHALYVRGPVRLTADVAGRVADAVEDYLDEHVWPSRDSEPFASR